MRHLLQDKRVVSGLVILATVTVWWRIHTIRNGFTLETTRAVDGIAPLRPPAKSSPDRSGSVKQAAVLFSAHGQDKGIVQSSSALKNWTSIYPDRELYYDPFATRRPNLARTESQDLNHSKTDELQLQAITLTPGETWAVINQEIVTVGEQIGSFKVMSIEPPEVHLTHPSGSTVLRLSPSSPVNTTNLQPKASTR